MDGMNWRKSSHSNGSGECVEVATWRKSRFSANGGEQCIEVGTTSDGVAIRDTKDTGHGPVLKVSPADWQRFTKAIKG